MNATRRRATARVSRFALKEGGTHEGRAQAHSPSPLTLVAPSPARMRVGARQEKQERPGPRLPAAIADDLLKGHLSQHCPVCGITEAAGGYCTKCDRRTGPADWFRQTRGRPVSGPQKTPENGLKRGPGRPRVHPGAAALVTQPTPDPDAGFGW
jgi:hypothetical protein